MQRWVKKTNVSTQQNVNPKLAKDSCAFIHQAYVGLVNQIIPNVKSQSKMDLHT